MNCVFKNVPNLTCKIFVGNGREFSIQRCIKLFLFDNIFGISEGQKRFYDFAWKCVNSAAIAPCHATPELSQLGKHVPDVWKVVSDAQQPPQHSQLGNEKISCENFVVLLFLLFSVKAESFCGYLVIVIIVVVVVVVVVFVVDILFLLLLLLLLL